MGIIPNHPTLYFPSRKDPSSRAEGAQGLCPSVSAFPGLSSHRGTLPFFVMRCAESVAVLSFKCTRTPAGLQVGRHGPRFYICDVGLISGPLLPFLSSSPNLGGFSPTCCVLGLCPSVLAICDLARAVLAPCGHFWTEPSTWMCLETAVSV